MAGKYMAYKAVRLTARPWMLLELDGSVDGRVVGDHMTEADCERIVRLLNQDEGREIVTEAEAHGAEADVEFEET